MMYSLDEIGLIPSAVPTDIRSRKQVNPFDENGKLPIFVSPMTSVLNDKNYKTFSDGGVIPVLPRNIKFDIELSKTYWMSVSLQEFEKMAMSDENEVDYNGCHVLVDIANGHIKVLYDLSAEFKTKWNKAILMVGNIGNPNMYRYCCASGIDYVRCGIGGGSVCIADGTKVKMANGEEKNIEDIVIGEQVKTSSTIGKVVEISKKKSNDCYNINNEIVATGNHKFMVVDKEDVDKIKNDEDIKQYAHWVEVSSLDKNKHMLVKF